MSNENGSGEGKGSGYVGQQKSSTHGWIQLSVHKSSRACASAHMMRGLACQVGSNWTPQQPCFDCRLGEDATRLTSLLGHDNDCNDDGD